MTARLPNSVLFRSLRSRRRNSAFTLVEMLVAVALVVLMMSLFATVFQLATGAMATQKAIAENDQRVRMVWSMLRADLNGEVDPTNPRPYRSFRKLVPFDPSDGIAVDRTDREGYFSISENDPDDPTDDVLQFTAKFDDAAADRYFGAAKAIFRDSTGAFGPSSPAAPPTSTTNQPPPAPSDPGLYWQNQPQFDDIFADWTRTGSAPAAEISYFLRNGVLYRRVMLLRRSILNTASPQPQDYSGNDLDTSSGFAASGLVNYGVGGAGNFFTDFDFSAYYSAAGPRFLSLDGSGGIYTSDPRYRFGHDVATGISREFAAGRFLGRFTHHETSSPQFGFPGRNATTSNPYSPSTVLHDDSPADGIVDEFANGTRGGEDALMTNVIQFDIKVWDDAASNGPDGVAGIPSNPQLGYPGSDDGDFKDVGHSGVGAAKNGFYAAPACQNTYYGKGKYDTWDPSGIDLDKNSTPDVAPYRPVIGGTALPLKAIQIRIAFIERTTNQRRDATLVFQFVSQ